MKVNIIKLACLSVLLSLITANNINAQSGQGCANVTISQLIGNDTVELSALDRNQGLKLTCDTASRILLPIGFAPGYPDPDDGYYTYERISYDPPQSFKKGTRITLPTDDCWSELFSFDYY
ncbi:MAG: hypothetical protein IJ681_07635, partial [Bacteroidales bacterium]|nr:hypothetical protein [Bacteroidales bacterium]